jgi:hypothetical protein
MRFFWESSFNDGTSQTVLDPLGRGPVRTHCAHANFLTGTGVTGMRSADSKAKRTEGCDLPTQKQSARAQKQREAYAALRGEAHNARSSARGAREGFQSALELAKGSLP